MNNPILAPAAARSMAAQALDHSFSGGRAGIRYENSSNQT
jgi:hypothetical protein